MHNKLKRTDLILYVFLPVFLAVITSAIVSLQFFQDGSSYFLEILQTHSAIRHHRLSVWVIQFPTIVSIKLLNKIPFIYNSDFYLPSVRFIFSFNYSLIPLLAITLSWLVIRKRNEALLIWPVLVILFVNLINFSWVSELLIALQLSCPLMLASITVPHKRLFWIINIILLPLIFFLHPLVLLFFITLAIGNIYISYVNVKTKKLAKFNALIFLLAAILRGILNIYMLNSYESSFFNTEGINDYLLPTTIENKIFLTICIIVPCLLLIAKLGISRKISFVKYIRPIIIFLPLLQILFVSLILLYLNLIPYLYKFLILLSFISYISLYQRYVLTSNQPIKNKFIYSICVNLSLISGFLLIYEYNYKLDGFHLKTGLSIFVAMLILVIAFIDSTLETYQFDCIQRSFLIKIICIVFTLVTFSQSFIWQSALNKAVYSIKTIDKPCIETISENFNWLADDHYKIINNWSLPSLLLAMQDKTPRKLLLPNNSCELFYKSQLVQIDPWSTIHKDVIIPHLE